MAPSIAIVRAAADQDELDDRTCGNRVAAGRAGCRRTRCRSSRRPEVEHRHHGRGDDQGDDRAGDAPQSRYSGGENGAAKAQPGEREGGRVCTGNDRSSSHSFSWKCGALFSATRRSPATGRRR